MTPTSIKSMLLSGIVLIACLYAEELVHYLRWDFKRDRYMVSAATQPGCTPVAGHPRYTRCTVPGFGRSLFRCTAVDCYYQDPSAPYLSPEEIDRQDSDVHHMFDSPKDMK